MKPGNFGSAHFGGCFKRTEKPALASAFIVLLLIGVVVAISVSISIQVASSAGEENSRILERWARLNELRALRRQWLLEDNEPIRAIIRLDPADLTGVEEALVVDALKEHADETQSQVIEFLNTKGASVLNKFWLANAILVEADINTLQELTSFPIVEEVHDDFKIKIPRLIEASDNSPSTNVTWGLHRIGAPDVWALGFDGSGIRVAVLDTGVEITHPDLVGKMWTDNPADSTYPGGWIEFDLNGNIVVGSTPYDTDMHGTHTSGTVVGGNASGTAIGVAPGAWLMHGLVLPGGYGSWAQVIAGMQWTLAPFDQYGNPAGEKADVVSMSWGADGYYDEMIEPVRNMKVAGVVPVAAIGNSGEWVSSCPGNVYEAFGIGAMDVYDSVPWWSSGEVLNWQESYPDLYIKPDFSGPGVNVYSSVPGGYYHASGTSMATPHVAGSVALLLSVNPALRVDDVYDVLKLTSDDLGDPGKDTRYGWGIVNAYGATVTAVYNSGIEGYVLDAETLDGIAGAKVVVQEMGWIRCAAENGYYRIFAPPDNYTLIVSAFGYYENVVIASVTENLWTTLNIELAPLPSGFIAGEVTDNAYSPIENATITLLETPLIIQTDNEGNFILKAPVGSYDVKAFATGYLPSYVYGIAVIENQTTAVDFQLREIGSAPLADTPWPKFRHDLLNTGQSPYLAAQENVLKWRCKNIDDFIVFPPSIGPDGTIYVSGTWFGMLYAISPEGQLKWYYNIGGPLGIWSSPAIGSNNLVYVGTCEGFFSSGELYAMTSEGDVAWVFADPERWPINSSPSIGPDGTIYLGVFNGLQRPLEGRFFALNPDSTVKWFYHATNGWIMSSPAISPDNTTVYFGTSGYNKGPEWNWENGELYAFYENGQQKWCYTVPDDGVWTSPAIGLDGTIYFQSCFGKLYAVDENGIYKWSQQVNGVWSSPAIGSDGTIYVGSDKLYTFYPDNGSIKWTYEDFGGTDCSPTIGSDGTIYFTSGDDRIYALNPDGTLKWSYYLPYQSGQTDPVIDRDGTIYFGNAETLYAIKGREVSISISPENQSAPPNQTLTYIVTVMNTGTIKDTYDLIAIDNSGWELALSENLLEDVQPGENRTIVLSVTIPRGTLPYTMDNVIVTATSRADPKVENSDSCIAHALVGREVEISLVTKHEEGLPGMRLSYRATVMNMGNVEDTYDLTVGDNAGWDLSISPTSLTLAPGQSNYVVIDVTIPEDAMVNERDNVIATAISREDVTVSASASCTARRCEASFELENLYKVGLCVDFYPDEGSKLVVQFYGYEDDYQAESVIWSGTTLTHIVLSENVPHPQGKPVEVVRLVLTDDEGNLVSKVAGFVVRRDHLWKRYVDILRRWSYASEEERIALKAEHDAIVEQWPRAPDKKLALSISPSSGGNSPGAMFSFSVKVKNMGDFTDICALTVSDNAGWELTIPSTTSTLVSGDSEVITLNVIVSPDAPIGTEDLVTVSATSINDPGIGAEKSCIAKAVLVNVKVSVSPSYTSDLPGSTLKYAITVTNEGEVQDTYGLTVNDNSGWELALSENLLENVQPGENRVVTLSVAIPIDAENCMKDNVVVTATSHLDPRVSTSASCIGHAITSKVVIIHPSVDIYAHGEDPGGAFSWPQLKFNISGTPPGTYVASAKLWFYRDYASTLGWYYGYGEAWNGYVELFRVDDQTWNDKITPSEFDAQILTDGQIHTDEFTEDGWGYLNVTNQLKVDHDAVNACTSFRLRNGSYDTSWLDTYSIIDDSLLEIMGGDWYELRLVRLRSNEYGGYEPYLEVAYTTEAQEAEVLISPSYASAQPGATLTYAVTVINLGDIEVTYSLGVTDNADWGPNISPTQLMVPAGENRTAMVSIAIPEGAIGHTEDNICVTAIGVGISISSTCVAHTAVVKGISVAISPSYKDGLPDMELDYAVTVRNEGNVRDTYILTVSDNSGWGLALSENLLENVQPRENRVITLSVTIPENLVDYVEDEVSVTAASSDNLTIVASSSCIAKHDQWAKFKLENLYKISLNVRLYPREGSKLIVEFYTYEENYQAESVIWSGTTPAYVILLENVPHPQGKPVEVARLVLADENGDTISIINGFVVRRDHLWRRYTEILSRWSYASEEERAALKAELDAIVEQWPRAPDKKIKMSISPSYAENLPGATICYGVKVMNTGDFKDTYNLTVSDNSGWGPTISSTTLTLPVGVSETVTLSITIPENATPDTGTGICVTATSQIAGVSASATCVARVIVIREVDVSISPGYQEGLSGSVLTYTVVVINEGNVWDNYSLSASDNAGWNLSLSPSTLTVPVGENRVATLSVTIPESAAPCTEDNVIVTAISQTDNTRSDNDSCIVHVKGVPLPSVIIRGDGNAHNEDQEGDAPWRWYGAGDYPSLMAAKRVGAGAVVASGTASTCRNGRWNTGAATAKFDMLLDEAFQWMVPGATRVLWYEGYGVYDDTTQCSDLIAALESKGYIITGNSSSITADLLAPHDILVIPELELGDKFVGGDPSSLPNADVEAIKSFVEGGKGLLIMEGSDYAGYNFYKVQNKILDALNFGLRFQHDEVEDPDFSEPYWFDAEVIDSEFGINYRTATGLTKVMVYGVCSFVAHRLPGMIGIYPSDDAYVSDSSPYNNYGSDPRLWVTEQPVGQEGLVYLSFLKFSLGDIPNDAIIKGAKLCLYCLGPDELLGWVAARRVDNDNWVEDTITWSNSPSIGPEENRVDVGREPGWNFWDVTSWIQNQFLDDGVVTILLAPETWTERIFASKEWGEENKHPYLEVTYE